MSEVIDPNTTALLSFIERAARDPAFDVNKFESLLRMQREVAQEEARRQFNSAMADVQNEIGDIRRSGKNPSFNNPYAKLEDLDNAARPIYTQHGFNVRYGSTLTNKDVPPVPPNNLRVVLIVSHSAGYSEEHHLDGPLDSQSGARARTAIQAVGSTATYLRRYLLQMVLNLVPAGDPSDDDGEKTRREPPSQDYRANLNQEIPLGRPARKAEKAPASRAGWLWTDEQYAEFHAKHGSEIELLEETEPEQWTTNFRMLFANAQSREEAVDLAAHPSIGIALAQAPERLRRDITAVLAEAYARFPEAEGEPDAEVTEPAKEPA